MYLFVKDTRLATPTQPEAMARTIEATWQLQLQPEHRCPPASSHLAGCCVVGQVRPLPEVCETAGGPQWLPSGLPRTDCRIADPA